MKSADFSLRGCVVCIWDINIIDSCPFAGSKLCLIVSDGFPHCLTVESLVVPELDKKSFSPDPGNFEDSFYARHFIDSLQDEVRKSKECPKGLVGKVNTLP
ncbi:hypothetical protein JHK82_055111 [Glycine max]|nr:hypothetical protein JHK86_054951 [Glycine max]KAG4917642.1 hypothetical protein JHK85_055923 [Glycine max]KAG5073743.1 hypothetical protein JHK84_054974 [Glycine max]KAG5076416.1 hypothetical protein JHK82_055111 [Glycine max]